MEPKIESAVHPELVQLWDEVERQQRCLVEECRKPGGCNADCCRSVESGFIPMVSPRERTAILEYLRAEQRPMPPYNPNYCQFLVEGSCTVYSVRPTECRTYHCTSKGFEEAEHVVPAAVNEPVIRYFEQNPGELEDSESMRALHLQHLWPATNGEQ